MMKDRRKLFGLWMVIVVAMVGFAALDLLGWARLKWLVLLVSSLVLGSWVSGRMSGQAKLKPKPPDEVVVALIGGGLVGIGAAIATGCVVGNIMSGWALMSVGGFLFGIVTLLSNWATNYFYLMGGSSRA